MTTDSQEVKKKRSRGAAAPFGNKYAVGNSGRPSKVDLPAMAKALDEWSKRDDALHFAEFSLEYDEYPQRLYEWRDKSTEFAETFKKAYARIALRLRKKLHDKENPYNYGVFMREIGMYDKMLDQHEDEKEYRKIDYKIKADAQSKVTATPQEVSTHDALLKQIEALQLSLDRKIEDTNKSTESKS